MAPNPAWLKRRWPVICVLLLAGLAGGYYLSRAHTPSYTATSYYVTSATDAGAFSATDSQKLASTYAALLPQDEDVASEIAPILGTSASSALRHLAVVLIPNSAVLRVGISAKTSQAATAASFGFSHAVSGAQPKVIAIVPDSVARISSPQVTASTVSLSYAGPIVGAIIGLLVAVGAATIVERRNPRIDTVDALTHYGIRSLALSRLSASSVWLMTSELNERFVLNIVSPLTRSERSHIFETLEAVQRRVGLPNEFATKELTELHERGNPPRGIVVLVPPGFHAHLLSDYIDELQILGRDVWAFLLVDRAPKVQVAGPVGRHNFEPAASAAPHPAAGGAAIWEHQ